MKISIVTICYNSEASIEDTIKSVAAQNYDNIEYIIVDGGSTDGTLAIVDKYKDTVTKVVSEKDDGLYDAINKGVKLATGDVVGLIHSDDFLASEDVVFDIAKYFRLNPSTDAIYGDLHYVGQFDTSKIIRKWISGNYTDGMFLKGWMPPHPTFYIKKEMYEKHGGYRMDFKFAADYELMLRMLHKHKINVGYINKVLVKMRVGGTSNASIKNRLKANREDRLAWKVNDVKPNKLTLTFKPLSKVFQYIGK